MRELIRKGQLEEAITLAIKLTNNTQWHDPAIAISAEFKKYKKEKIMGILSTEEDRLQHAKLVARLLGLMEQFEQEQITLIKEDFTALVDELSTQSKDDSTNEIAQKASEIVQTSKVEKQESGENSTSWYEKVRDFLIDTADSESKQSKAIKGVKRGAEILVEIAKKYNTIAPWLGLIQVPGIFL